MQLMSKYNYEEQTYRSSQFSQSQIGYFFITQGGKGGVSQILTEDVFLLHFLVVDIVLWSLLSKKTTTR